MQLDSLRKTANLPVGFEYSVFHQPVKWFYPLFLKLLGIIISGLAASFGGPFWFLCPQKNVYPQLVFYDTILQYTYAYFYHE